MAISFRGVRYGVGTKAQFRTETEHAGGGLDKSREDLAGLADSHLGCTISFVFAAPPELSAEERRYVDHVKDVFVAGLKACSLPPEAPIKWLKEPAMVIKSVTASDPKDASPVRKEGEYLALVTFRFALADHPRVRVVVKGLRGALAHGSLVDQCARKAAVPEARAGL
jgi:hypothetical protein